MDQILHIKTEGIQTDGKDTYFNHRYEPTPYSILEQLFVSYPLKKSDTLVDFGCGMGRLNFFAHYLFGCNTIGIELNPKYYNDAVANLTTYVKKDTKTIKFECIPAESYLVKQTDNTFYFFNPFSVEIFQKVIKNILLSYENSPRKVSIILYYPHEDYLYYLEHQTGFELVMEIPIKERFAKNSREVFLIYQLGEREF